MPKKLRNHFRGSIFEWLALTPSAWQVVVVLLAGHIAPGVLGVLVEKWREYTYGFWREIVNLISLEISGLEDIFDLYTLALLMLLAAGGTALRQKPEDRINLLVEFQQSSGWARRLLALRVALILTIYIVLFSISSASTYFESIGTNNVYASLAAGYIIAFLFTYIGAEYYFGFPETALTDRVETDRLNRVHSAWFVFAWPGLAVYASIFTFITFFTLASFRLLAPMNYQVFYLKLFALWFLGLWLSHVRLNWPSAKSLVEFTKMLLNVAFLSGLVILALAPFAWTSIELRGGEDRALIGGLMFGGAIALTLGFSQVLRVDWTIARSILAIVFVIVVGDQVLGFITSLAPERP